MMLRLWRRWLSARMTLGWALAKHLMMGPWAARRTRPERWLSQMAKEQLGATPAENWQLAPKAARCIGCGLCDLYGTTTLARPSQLILGGPRMPADAPLWEAELKELEKLRKPILSVCPTQVDVDDVVAWIRNNAQVLKATRHMG